MDNPYHVLETNRLILQTFQWDLFPELSRLLANPVVHRYFPHPLNELEAKEFMSRVLDQQTLNGYSLWAVFKKDNSDFIGLCGLLKQLVDAIEEVEVGYRLDNAFWGHGFGAEAAAGCVEYARNVLRVPSVISLIRPINTPSIRVAEKNGFVPEKETLFCGLPHWVYRKQLI